MKLNLIDIDRMSDLMSGRDYGLYRYAVFDFTPPVWWGTFFHSIEHFHLPHYFSLLSICITVA